MTVPAYGGQLVDLTISDEELTDRLKGVQEAVPLVKHDLINLINIAVGCYSPLHGFMTEEEYGSVISSNRLPEGLNWTIPILLNVKSQPKEKMVALTNTDGDPIAVLEIQSTFELDKEKFCLKTFGTVSNDHPGVQNTLKTPALCIGGPIYMSKSRIEEHRYFCGPQQTRKWLAQTGGKTFTAFSTRNICHLGHEYLHNFALETTDILGINIITGAQIKGNFIPDVLFDTYEYILSSYYPKDRCFINNLRLPPIYGGPKEAFLQAIVLQNYGFSHFIVGRDHAGIGGYYPQYASQQIFSDLADIGMKILTIPEPRFCKICKKVTTERTCKHIGENLRLMNGRDVRRLLLERRYDELKTIIRKDLQELVIKLFEDKTDLGCDELSMERPKQIFYDL